MLSQCRATVFYDLFVQQFQGKSIHVDKTDQENEPFVYHLFIGKQNTATVWKTYVRMSRDEKTGLKSPSPYFYGIHLLWKYHGKTRLNSILSNQNDALSQRKAFESLIWFAKVLGSVPTIHFRDIREKCSLHDEFFLTGPDLQSQNEVCPIVWGAWQKKLYVGMINNALEFIWLRWQEAWTRASSTLNRLHRTALCS